MKGIDKVLSRDGIIYVAGRLFEVEEKLKSERLELAVLAGVAAAAQAEVVDLPRRPTFVPFRDAGQEGMVSQDKTRRLFDLDVERLRRTVLLVAYIDGLSKDEGVCFEVGFAYAAGARIVLVSTDFFDIEFPNGQRHPLDPLLTVAADILVRQPQLVGSTGDHQSILRASRRSVLSATTAAVSQLLLEPAGEPPMVLPDVAATGIFADFGGGVFEWQERMLDGLSARVEEGGRVRCMRATRYSSAAPDLETAARMDLAALVQAQLLITCTDADEAFSGTAFLQGVMCALGRPVWMYNSKRTAICASGGYRSSRNLMLDYSATRVYRSFDELVEAAAGL